ncbi:MAG: hypothetical protein ACJ76H_06520 [Bacteriovoracaceae bacterium]
MTYYFVSFDPAKFGEFTERFPALDGGSWIKNAQDLKAALQSGAKASIFFFDLPPDPEAIDDWVMIVRDASPSSRIIFVTSDMKPHDLKVHQLSPVGGDAYVSRNASPETLERILSGLGQELTNLRGNKLEDSSANVASRFDMSSLIKFKNNDLNKELDELFREAAPEQKQKPKFQSLANLTPEEGEDDGSGANMSDKDQELSLTEFDELEISDTPELPPETPENESGLDLDLGDGLSLDLGDADVGSSNEPLENLGEIDLGGGDDLSLGKLDLGSADLSEAPVEETNEDEPSGLVLTDNSEAVDLDFGSLGGEISADAKEKLAEIDAIMEHDSKIMTVPEDLNLLEDAAEMLTGTGGGEGNLSLEPEPDFNLAEAESDSLDLGGIDDSIAESKGEEKALNLNLADEGFAIADIAPAGSDDHIDSDLDQPLVSDDIDLGNLDFGSEPEEESKPVVAAAPEKEKTLTSTKIKRKKEKEEKSEVRVVQQPEKPMGQELREISGAYSAELERMQATLSNLRSDREELLAKIQNLEEEKLLHNRQTLSLRAELDEKKIELSIVRKKLNEDISELKDRVRLEEERRLILEEKNRVLREEVEKSAQKNRIDVKKVQLHERELEQRLELLKADAETQIRNRDLKILELKRKIDAMEFDMESIQTQEKRTVESRFELEDKLEKAIKTLRGAISVLEDETDKGAALEALKKNIDM